MERARALWPINVRFSDPHATARIARLRVSPDQIDEVIRGGFVQSRRFENGEWRYRIEGRTSDEQHLACIITFEEQRRRLVIITLYRCRPRKREVDEGDRS
ncbi:MAG: DUF4258 domain-containing protein [Acidobacteria bacterium]|nr:DUF4258 domain-containing protein [Acidobacteriota bacterium]